MTSRRQLSICPIAWSQAHAEKVETPRRDAGKRPSREIVILSACHGCNPCTSPVLSSQSGAIVVVTAEPQPFDLAVLPAVARGLGSYWPQRDDSKMAAVHLGAMLAVVVTIADWLLRGDV
jgi:hypothetical protein